MLLYVVETFKILWMLLTLNSIMNTNLSILSDVSCWTGIGPSIVEKLQKDLNFTYEYVASINGSYGMYDEETG